MTPDDYRRRKSVIAHRGAAAYAPENTLASFELARQQGANSVEQDLQVTRDGVLVCLHDRTLERTTNVRDLFPDRGPAYVHEFDLTEIRELDAGGWFSADFAGARIPTFDEVLAWAGDRSSLLVELKDPEIYQALGFDVLAMFAAALDRHDSARTRSRGPEVTVQSFDEPLMRRAAEIFDSRIPVVLLIEPADAPQWADRDRLAATAEFATGIGPGKDSLQSHPDMVRWAHEARLRVTPWTFRAAEPGRFSSVRAEMAYYLSVLDVDGVITDNPDQFPRELV